LEIIVSSFVLILVFVLLSVYLRFTSSDYPFGIFKLFLVESRTLFLNCSELGNITELNIGHGGHDIHVCVSVSCGILMFLSWYTDMHHLIWNIGDCL